MCHKNQFTETHKTEQQLLLACPKGNRRDLGLECWRLQEVRKHFKVDLRKYEPQGLLEH